MTTSTELLTIYNELAPQSGHKTLKSWSGSKKSLQERIDALTKVRPEPAPADGDDDDGMISVADVARELKINPKVARAKLRRRGQTSSDGRWGRFMRGSPDHKAIVKVLKNGRKDQ